VWNVGDFVGIPLGDGTNAFGRILRRPLIAFYDLRSHVIPPFHTIAAAPVIFVTYVMKYAVTQGIWRVLGNAPLSEDLRTEPLFFKRDPITRKLTIYRDSTGEETPASREECLRLERAAVWDPERIVDRLRDHFAGRPNKWVESMRP
jgi:hypothetical protein